MKKFAAVLIFMMAFYGSFSQDITGQWNGALKIQGTQLRIVFHISKSSGGYTSTMDSPDQGAKGIPVTSTTFENSKLRLEIANLKFEYTGELKDKIFEGTMKQSGMEFPMNLSKETIEKQTFVRPQEPKKPYPYYSEEVTFQNPTINITLARTLTLPQKEGRFPAVILVTGSGPQNRDEEIMGHKPFLVLSDYLTRNGIAVLRYDDRGVGQSKGNFQTAITEDFAADAESAVAYLKTRKDISKIGIAGHSEGGIVAPMVASRSKDVGFIVMLAGTGLRGDKILLMQQELIARASGGTEADIKKTKENNSKVFEIILKSKSDVTLKEDLKKFLVETVKSLPAENRPKGMTDEDFISMQLTQITSPWMLNFIRYDPVPALEKVKCPVLAVNGEKDLQVPPKEDLAAIEKALKKGGNKQVTIMEFKGLNHLFQECKTGLPSEYSEIEQTFSPVAMEEISKWILEQTK
jgi:alpha/beta superfamily hydrolase